MSIPENLKVVIPAAGGGTRLKPHTHTTPKVLLHVAGKPILGHIMDLVVPLQPQEVVVVVGPQREQIESYLTGAYQLKLSFAVQEEPQGLGHAVAQARDFARGAPTLVLLGDTILDLDLKQMVGGGNQLGVRVVDDPRRFGVVELEDGAVVHVVEKPTQPRSNLAIVGVYYFQDSRPLFDALDELIRQDQRTRGEFQLTDALELMVCQGVRIQPATVDHWLDCGTPDAMLDTNRYLLARKSRVVTRPGVVVIPPVCIEDSAVIHHSVIGPNVSIGERVQIHRSLVRDSIVNHDAIILDAMLGHSILGPRAKVQGTPLKLNLGDSSEFKAG
jgi:glucose-1-phosphate thymidylyltransferase